MFLGCLSTMKKNRQNNLPILHNYQNNILKKPFLTLSQFYKIILVEFIQQGCIYCIWILCCLLEEHVPNSHVTSPLGPEWLRYLALRPPSIHDNYKWDDSVNVSHISASSGTSVRYFLNGEMCDEMLFHISI